MTTNPNRRSSDQTWAFFKQIPLVLVFGLIAMAIMWLIARVFILVFQGLALALPSTVTTAVSMAGGIFFKYVIPGFVNLIWIVCGIYMVFAVLRHIYLRFK